jgi:hypothetical protein
MRCRWPRLLRVVRAWLAPVLWLERLWPTCFDKPPPVELDGLHEFLLAGCAINLYLRL